MVSKGVQQVRRPPGKRSSYQRSTITQQLAAVLAPEDQHRDGAVSKASRQGMVLVFSLVGVAGLVGFLFGSLPGLMVGFLLSTVFAVSGLAFLSASIESADDLCYCPENVRAVRGADRCCRKTGAGRS